MMIHKRSKHGQSSRPIMSRPDQTNDLRIMLYGGDVLCIEKCDEVPFSEYAGGFKVTLQARETNALISRLKEERLLAEGDQWNATLGEQGWLNPFEARRLREEVEQLKARITALASTPTTAAPKPHPEPSLKPAVAPQPTGSLLPKLPLPPHLRKG